MQVEYKFNFTDEFLVEAVARHRSSVWWRYPFVGVKWLLAAICAVLVWVSITHHLMLLTLFFSACVGLLLIGWPIDVFILKRRFRKSPYRDSEVNIVLDETGLHTSQKQGKSELSWQAFTKARKLEDGILLYQGPSVYNWLPDRAAIVPGAIDTAINIIQENIGDFKKI